MMSIKHYTDPELLYEEKKDFYNWQVENGSGYLVSVSEKEWENGIELLKNAEKRSGR